MGILDKYRKQEEEAAAKPELSARESLGEGANDAALKFIDTISFGGLPALRDKIASLAGVEQPSSVAAVEEAGERSPIASALGTAAGYVLPAGGVTSAIAKGAGKMAPGMLPFMRGWAGQGVLQGAGSAATATIDELAREGLSGGDDPFELGRVMREGLFGAGTGAALRGGQSLFDPKLAVGTRLTNLKPGEKVPTAGKDPAGLLDPGVPLTGPEALKQAGKSGDARTAQTLLKDMGDRAPAALEDSAALKAVAGRGPRLNAAEQRLADEARVATEAATAARPTPETRLTGINRQIPPGAREVPGAATLPGSKESLGNVEARLARLREEQLLRPTPERAADIAAGEAALGRKIPTDVAAAEATGKLGGFQDWRSSLPVEPFPPSEQSAAMGLLGRVVSPRMAAAVSQTGQDLMHLRTPTLNPGGVAETLTDPAKLIEALSPEDLLRMIMSTGTLGSLVHGGTGFAQGKTGGKNRPIVD